MAVRTVRIYPGEKQGSNIIGFSLSAGVAPTDERLQRFTNERNYTMREVARHVGSVSSMHVEIEPPLSDEDTPAFVELCGELVESSNNIAVVIDNRTPGENVILLPSAVQ